MDIRTKILTTSEEEDIHYEVFSIVNGSRVNHYRGLSEKSAALMYLASLHDERRKCTTLTRSRTITQTLEVAEIKGSYCKQHARPKGGRPRDPSTRDDGTTDCHPADRDCNGD